MTPLRFIRAAVWLSAGVLALVWIAMSLPHLLRAESPTELEPAMVLDSVKHRKDQIAQVPIPTDGGLSSQSHLRAEVSEPQLENTAAIQAELDSDTLMLYFQLGLARSYLWALSTDGIESYDLPGSKRLDLIARHVSFSLSRSHEHLGRIQRERHAGEASQLLLGPVSHLLGKYRRLVVVADGALRGLPFAALPRPNWQPWSPLLLSHEVLYLPSVSAMVELRSRQASRNVGSVNGVAVFADPVYALDDPRFRPSSIRSRENEAGREFEHRSWPDLARLPGSQQEAQAIASLADGVNYVATGFEATVEATRLAAAQYRILHLAAHAKFDSSKPGQSGLVLSLFDPEGQPVDGVLRFQEIPNLDLAADLVVLSGCQTGVSPDGFAEDEFGLAGGFLRAGAAHVIASQWSVDDRATSELMVGFYDAMKTGLSPAAALRSAQLNLSQDERWHSPFYWAGFIVVGDWR